jgi:hypothetical protein
MKQCTKCQKIKDSSSFRKNKSTPDGLSYSCKECLRDYDKSVYNLHKEERRLYAKKQRKKHLPRRKRYDINYYHNHVMENLERVENWKIHNKERWRELRLKATAKRSRKYGFKKIIENPFDKSEPIEWHHTDDEYVVPVPLDIHQHFKCRSTTEHRELLEFVVVQVTNI